MSVLNSFLRRRKIRIVGLKVGKLNSLVGLEYARIRHAYKEGWENKTLMELEADGKSMARFNLDFADWAPEEQFSIQEVECLRVLEDNDNVLILRGVKELRGHYQRIGLAFIDPEWFGSGGFRKEFLSII